MLRLRGRGGRVMAGSEGGEWEDNKVTEETNAYSVL